MSQSNAYEIMFALPEMPLLAFSSILDMRLNGSLCDVTFYVRGKKILAHRVILAASIPYFKEMFLSSAVSPQREIILEMVEAYAFESLIEFAYTNEIKINNNSAKSLLVGATFLKMDEVCNACTKFISRRLHPGNALEILNFASAKNFEALKAASEDYVLKHFIEISRSEEFLDMSFSDLKELISKDELHVTCEEEVFQAVITWVKRSPSDRLDKLPLLLSVVRLSLLSYHYLSTTVANEKLIENSMPCVNLVNEAKARVPFHSYQNMNHRSFTVDSYQAVNNSYDCKVNNYLYALCRLKDKEAFPTVVARYNLMTGEWKKMSARTTFVDKAAVAVMDKKLYVIGGCNSMGRLLDAVQVFDVESDSWSFVESFPSKISQAVAAVYSGKIYVFGGHLEDKNVVRYVYCYSPETKWKYLGKMYQARKGACAITVNDSIYILGGYSDKMPLTSVEMYSPTKDDWEKVSSLGTEINSCNATSSPNRIYVCGNMYIQFYDEYLKEWDKICKVPWANIKGRFIWMFQERLYLIVEKLEGRSTDENYVYIYDLKDDKWTNGKALPSNLTFISAVAITEP